MTGQNAAPEAAQDHYNAVNGFIDNDSIMPSGELDMLELAIKATNPDSIEGQAFLRYMYTNKLEAMAETWVTNWASQQHGQADMSASELGPQDLSTVFHVLPFDEAEQAREYEVNGMNDAVAHVALEARHALEDQTALTGIRVQDRGDWFVEVQTSGKSLNADGVGKMDWSRKGDPKGPRIPAFVSANYGTPVARWTTSLHAIQTRLQEGIEADGRLTPGNTQFLFDEMQRLGIMQTTSEHAKKKSANPKWFAKDARAAVEMGRYPYLRIIEGSDKLPSGANNPRGCEVTGTELGQEAWAERFPQAEIALQALLDFTENHDEPGKGNTDPKAPTSYVLICPALLEPDGQDNIAHVELKVNADQAARLFVPDYYRGKRGTKGKQLNGAWTDKHTKLHAPVCNCMDDGKPRAFQLANIKIGTELKPAQPELEKWAAAKLKEAQDKQTRAESKKTQQGK